jgi:hypothetical protein
VIDYSFFRRAGGGHDLDEILELLGPLDDAPGENPARDRFRSHLAKSVTTPGALRDYIENCLLTVFVTIQGLSERQL